jgi:hypothetical protein
VGQNDLNILCEISKAKTIQQIADLCFSLFGNPIFIEDMSRTILAFSRNTEIGDPEWNDVVIKNRSVSDPNGIGKAESKGVHKAALDAQSPILVTDTHSPYPRIIKVLTNGGQPIGTFVLTAFLTPFQEDDTQKLELVSSFLTSTMLSEKFIMSSSDKAVENVFLKLLDGDDMNPESAVQRLNELKWKQREFNYVLAIGDSSGNAFIHMDIINQLKFISNCSVFFYQCYVVCIWSSMKAINQWTEEVAYLANQITAGNYYVGVSRSFSQIDQLRSYYWEAVQALKIGIKIQDKSLHFFQYDMLSVYHLFGQFSNQVNLRDYCHEKILILDQYDADHNTQLVTTLQVYLENSKQINLTASILFVHRNTIRYRISKCMEILETDFEEGNEIFPYIFSLKILEFHKSFISQPEQHVIAASPTHGLNKNRSI